MTWRPLSPYELILLPHEDWCHFRNCSLSGGSCRAIEACHLPVPQMWAQPRPVLSFMPLPSWLCSKAWKRVLALSILVHSVLLHLGILWHLMWNLLLWLSHSESERQTTPHVHTHSGLLVFKCFPVGLCIRPKLFVGDPGFDFFFYAKLQH